MDATVLVVTADSHLADTALRWAAAVGATAEVVADVAAVRPGWRRARVVLVGGDLAADLVVARVPRREAVLLVTGSPEPPWERAVALGAAGVFVVPGQEDRLLDALGAALDGGGEACLVSVVGGAGGAGASTLAAGLGLGGARRGLRSLVVDADPLGAGIDLVLGAEDRAGLRWSELDPSRGRVGAEALDEVLPRHRGLAVLSWGREPAVVESASAPPLIDAATSGFDLVVADVPRALDPLGAELVSRSVLTVLVVPDDVRSVGAARLVRERLLARCGDVVAVVASRRGGLGRAEVGSLLGCPVVARVRRDHRLAAAIDRGHGPGRSRSLRRASTALLDLVGLESAS